MALALHHRDRYAPDVALRSDLNRLLVAARPQRQACRKAGGFDRHIDLAAACRS